MIWKLSSLLTQSFQNPSLLSFIRFRCISEILHKSINFHSPKKNLQILNSPEMQRNLMKESKEGFWNDCVNNDDNFQIMSSARNLKTSVSNLSKKNSQNNRNSSTNNNNNKLHIKNLQRTFMIINLSLSVT